MSVEIGGEISQKIRSAIKAKLVDLGAYVDDELPDYIMVMVANKKTKEQMTEDLNLFLGDNTEKFTSWLAALLDKLHSISTGSETPPAPVQTPVIPAVTDPVVETSTVNSVTPDDVAIPGLDLAIKTEVDSETLDDKPPTTSSGKKSETSQKRTSDQHDPDKSDQAAAKKARVSDIAKPPETESMVKAFEIEIDPSRDELDVDIEENAKRPVLAVVRTERSAPLRKPTARPERSTNTDRPAPRTGSTDRPPPRTGIASPIRARKNTGHALNRPSSRPNPRQPRPEREEPVSRRKVSSAIGAIVTKEPVQIQEEEEYDPYKPAIGNVASVVKVSERKSKVPSAWQADKSILLKAVDAAQSSIEKSKKLPGKAIVHPTMHHSSSSSSSRHEERDSLRRRLGDRPGGNSRSSGMRSDRILHRRSPTRIRHQPSRDGPSQTRHHDRTGHSERSGRGNRSGHADRASHGNQGSASYRGDTGSQGTIVKTVHQENSERSVQVFKSIQKENDSVFDRLKSTITIDKQDEESSNEGRKEYNKNNMERQEKTNDSRSDQKVQIATDFLDLSLPEDSRLIECDPEDVKNPQYPTPPPYESTLPSRSSLTTLVESGAEESDFTDGEGDDNRVVRERERVHRQEARPPSPKFVVTLDGADADMLKKDVKFDSDSDGDEVKLEHNIVRVAPRPQIPAPQIQPIMVNLGLEDEYNYMDCEETPVTDVAMKSAEKCRFFPSCMKGEECPYFHPSELCSKFPRCKFGDKCLYIHPPCKFDSTCTRPGCAFSHTSKKPPPRFQPPVPVIVQPIRLPVFFPGGQPPRLPAPTKHPSEVTCKFFPTCTNMNCAFYHPKPCRFGIACNSKDGCRFSHPKLPNKQQMFWSNKNNQNISSTTSPTSPPVAPQQPLVALNKEVPC